MAKGDKSRSQGMINQQGNIMQQGLDTLKNNYLVPQYNMMNQNYQNAVTTDMNTYNQNMGNYQNFINSLSGGGGGTMNIGGGGGISTGPGSAYSTFQDFANTGGLSDADQQNLRERAISPTRAVYQNAQSQLARSQNLGSSANYAAAQAKMARDLAYGISDANVNANASIAQMIQQGKLSGAQGMAGIEEANAANALSARGQNISGLINAMQGETGLYSATPGLMATTGNQMLGASSQLGNAQEMQNQIGSSLMTAQNQNAQIPGDFMQAMNNVGGFMNSIVKPVAGIMTGFDFGGGSSSGAGTGATNLPGLSPTNTNFGYAPSVPSYNFGSGPSGLSTGPINFGGR